MRKFDRYFEADLQKKIDRCGGSMHKVFGRWDINLYLTEKGSVMVRIEDRSIRRAFISLSWSELQGIGMTINQILPDLPESQGVER